MKENKITKLREEYFDDKITKSEFINEIYKLHNILFDYAAEITNTSINKIEIQDGQVVMTFRESGIKLLCLPGDKRIACLDAFNFLKYEEEELMMQYELIQNGDIIVDIGGNYGWYCLHLANKFPDSKIYSFEPIPNTFKVLNFNINLNQIKNIITVNYGLSDSIGEFDFFCDPNLTVNASLNNVNDNPDAIKITCKVDILDKYIQNNFISKVDFIKCDIEGAELFALKGSQNILTNHKPKLFVEMLRKWTKKFEYHPNDIIFFLKNLGYACFKISENCKLIEIFEISENTIETNFVFLHKEEHKVLIQKLTN